MFQAMKPALSEGGMGRGFSKGTVSYSLKLKRSAKHREDYLLNMNQGVPAASDGEFITRFYAWKVER